MASRLWLLAIPAAVAAASACGSSTLPAARILSVESPSQSPTQHIGYIGEDLVLTVTGEGFSDGIVPNAGDPDASKTDRAQMFIQLQGAAAPALVVGTFLSATLFEGTLPTDPGVYDLTLLNGDGEGETITGAFQMGYRATTLMVSTTATEPAPGDVNKVTFEMRLLAANGVDPGIWKQPLDLSPAFATTNSTFALQDTPLDFDVAPGETFLPATMTVVDSAKELVIVTVPLLDPGITLELPTNQIAFIPGPAVRARVLTATEVAGNLVDTFLQVEDAWGNMANAHLAYQAGNFAFVPSCVGGGAVVEPILVAASSGTAAVQFTCNVPGVKTVVFTEDTSTPYANGGGTIIFN